MHPSNGKHADLFIPVGHNKSKTSSTGTESSLSTATATMTARSGATTPTTVSTRRSARDATPKSLGTSSPGSIRYTISGPTPDMVVPNAELVSTNTTQNSRPNSVHIRRHSRKITSEASPIQELTMRLSRATGNDLRDSTLSGQPMTNMQADSTEGSLGHHVSTHKPAVLPAFTFPGNMPASMELNGLSESTVDSSSAEPPRTPPSEPAPRLEGFPPILSPSIRPSHSRSSSRSDRSFPPASFPTDFYAHQKSPRKSKSRSNSARHSPSRRSSRSTSPLKFQITDSEASETKPPTSKLAYSYTQVSSTSSLGRFDADSGSRRSSSSASRRSGLFPKEVHYYTACVHTSPPTTRPLDVQPILTATRDPPRSVIPGSCFDCDTLDRREMESSILLGYNPRISAHTTDLATILASLEEESPISPLLVTNATTYMQNLALRDGSTPMKSQHRDAGYEDWQSDRRQSDSSAVSEESDGEALIYRIQALQDRIAELTHQRDIEVKEVWKGYTQRWGPGVLGPSRAIESDRATIRTAKSRASSRRSTGSERSQLSHYDVTDGRMRVDWVRNLQL